MQFVRFQVGDYKSFLHSNPLMLTSGFNVIVGRNNSGKTALIETLSLNFRNTPHRSTDTAPRATTSLADRRSWIKVRVRMLREELFDLSSPNEGKVVFPADTVPQADQDSFISRFNATSVFEIEATYEGGAPMEAELVGFGSKVRNGTDVAYSNFRWSSDETLIADSVPSRIGVAHGTFPLQMAYGIMGRIFFLLAERMNIGESPRGPDRILASDASNLPPVLDQIQSDRVRSQRLNDAIQEVFPDLSHISSKPIEDQQRLRLLVWENEEREDLAVPLAESGTGIGQVLAILSVIIMSDFARVLIIDEPQSFLHPGAIRRLFEVMRKWNKLGHQYIITTHSPTAVAAASPSNILLVKKESAASTIELIDPGEAEQARMLLAEVGARLSDVFGYDEILWVEGKTEELCFPPIIRDILKIPLHGTAILGLVQTGDLSGKDAERVSKIYRRLSGGTALLAPAVGFVLDRENLTEEKIKDLTNRFKGKLRFLPRRLFENYLIHPEALSSLANTIEGFSTIGDLVTPKMISDWLEQNRWSSKYFVELPTEVHRTEELWVTKAHGGRVLQDMFSSLSDTRVNYDKIRYGPWLTEWFIANDQKQLSELTDFLGDILGPNA